jgi:hypothetical protein
MGSALAPRSVMIIQGSPTAGARNTVVHLAVICWLALATQSAAQEDVAPGAPAFKQGDVITLEKIKQLKPFLPPEFWANRDFFFYEGMQLQIGPSYRNYGPPDVYNRATERFRGQARIGPESSLQNYTAGQPFPIDEIDCAGDPEAGAKIVWNFDYRWDGAGPSVGRRGSAGYFYSYWDRGEELPLYYQGTSRFVYLSHRPEPQHLAENGGDVLKRERRKFAWGIEVDAPFDARGIKLITYRYKASDNPKAESTNDDTWVYVPTLRRVRRISTAQRTDAVSGTDFTFDDLFSFSGIVPQYEWKCLGETDILAPVNSQVKAFPYKRDHNFGPYGLSYADDNWELRHALKIRFLPNDSAHPYHHKDIYLDKQTLEPLYSFAYDHKGELWKIIWHNHRWSEDSVGQESAREYYPGWEGVPEPRDLIVVSDTIVNVQTGTGNRIEFWDRSGTPLKSKGKMLRYIDIGRLTKGR